MSKLWSHRCRYLGDGLFFAEPYMSFTGIGYISKNCNSTLPRSGQLVLNRTGHLGQVVGSENRSSSKIRDTPYLFASEQLIMKFKHAQVKFEVVMNIIIQRGV